MLRMIFRSLSASSCLAITLLAGCGARPDTDAESIARVSSSLNYVKNFPVATGYWSFERCRGVPYDSNFTVYDDLANGADGGITGSVYCPPGQYGNAASFGGGRDAVTIANDPRFDFADKLTVSAWVKPTFARGAQTIVNKWYAPDSYLLMYQEGAYVFSVAAKDAAGSVRYFNVRAAASPGVFTHVAGVYDGQSLRLYLNGQIAHSVAQFQSEIIRRGTHSRA